MIPVQWPALLDSSSLQGHFPWDFSKKILEESNTSLLNSKIETLFGALLPPQIQKLSWMFTSLTRPSSFVTIRSSRASPLAVPLIILLWTCWQCTPETAWIACALLLVLQQVASRDYKHDWTMVWRRHRLILKSVCRIVVSPGWTTYSNMDSYFSAAVKSSSHS